MSIIRYTVLGLFLFFTQTALAGKDPISWKISSGSIPTITHLNNSYLIQYTFTSNLPFTMPTPLIIAKQPATGNEFTFADNCSNKKLASGQSCTVSIGFNPKSAGNKTASLTMSYGVTTVPLPTITTSTFISSQNTGWVGLIGVDYNPNHYASGSAFNNHDVFYTATANGNAVSNTYMEMAQLQAAGFQAVRSYQTVEYAWIDIINQANALGMNVIYEANIPQNGSNSDIAAAISFLASPGAGFMTGCTIEINGGRHMA